MTMQDEESTSDPTLRIAAVRGIGWNGSSSTFITLLQLGTIALMAHILGPAELGIYAILLNISGFSQVFLDAGLSGAIIHRLSPTPNELSSLYWLNVAIGVGLTIILVGVAPFIADAFGEPRLRTLIPILALSFVIISFGMQFQVLLEKSLQFRIIAQNEIIAATAGAIVTVAMAAFGGGIYALVAGQMVTTCLLALMLLSYGLRSFRPGLHFRFSDLSGYAQFAGFQLMEKTMAHFLMRSDQYLIGLMLGPQALGYYTLAFNLTAMPVSRLGRVLSRVAFPVYSAIQEDSARLRSGYLQAVRMMAIVGGPILLGIAAVASTFIPVFLGEKWSPSIESAQILALSSLLNLLMSPLASIILAKGRPGLSLLWSLGQAAVQAPAVYLVLKSGSLEGVALVALGIALANLLVCLLIQKLLLHSSALDYLKTIALPLAISSIMGLSVLLVSSLIGGNGARYFLIEVLVGATVFAGLALIFLWSELAGILSTLRSRVQVGPPSQ